MWEDVGKLGRYVLSLRQRKYRPLILPVAFYCLNQNVGRIRVWREVRLALALTWGDWWLDDLSAGHLCPQNCHPCWAGATGVGATPLSSWALFPSSWRTRHLHAMALSRRYQCRHLGSSFPIPTIDIHTFSSQRLRRVPEKTCHLWKRCGERREKRNRN